MKNALLSELRFEADNTRKLFKAITDDVLGYRPNDFNWTIGQLAAHTAEVYNWWEPTLHLDDLDLAKYHYEKGDISTIEKIKAKLEKNISTAIKCLEEYPEEKLLENWSMSNAGQQLMPPTPRIQVIRGFLMNHLYHHRGELIAYLRANGKPVPGLYGASYEEAKAMMQP